MPEKPSHFIHMTMMNKAEFETEGISVINGPANVISKNKLE